MLTIDGSTLEGGGQLTRLSLSLAAITRTAVRIYSIRAGRSAYRRAPPSSQSHSHSHSQAQSRDRNRSGNDRDQRRGKHTTTITSTGSSNNSSAGGLKDSHLAALTFLSEHTSARVTGAEIGSTKVTFRPSPTRHAKLHLTHKGSDSDNTREYTIALTKPGSVWLIFQAVFPFLVFDTVWSRPDSTEGVTGVKLTLRGGTNASKAMSTEYMTQVFLPVARRIGLPELTIETVERGWAGNAPGIGEVVVTVSPPPSARLNSQGRFVLPAFEIVERGEVEMVDVSVVADPVDTRAEVVRELCGLLAVAFPWVGVNVVLDEPSGDERRLYILLVARTRTGERLGCDYIGGGGRARSVVEARKRLREACVGVVKELERDVRGGGCVDKHMQDQLVGFQALAEGRSVVVGSGTGLVRGDRGVAEGSGNGGNIGGVYVDEDGNEVDASKVENVGDDGGTLHTRTVRWVCESLLQEYGVKFEEGGVCHGIGWNGSAEGMLDSVSHDLSSVSVQEE